MNWADSAPSTRTAFERFLLEHFGIYTSLSNEQQWLLSLAVIVAVPILIMVWNDRTTR